MFNDSKNNLQNWSFQPLRCTGCGKEQCEVRGSFLLVSVLFVMPPTCQRHGCLCLSWFSVIPTAAWLWKVLMNLKANEGRRQQQAASVCQHFWPELEDAASVSHNGFPSGRRLDGWPCPEALRPQGRVIMTICVAHTDSQSRGSCCLPLWDMIAMQVASANMQLLCLFQKPILVLFLSVKTQILYFRYWFDNSENPDLNAPSLFILIKSWFSSADECGGVWIKKKAGLSFFMYTD